MKNTKSKEFLSEVNILCKVHHSNLVSLYVMSCLLGFTSFQLLFFLFIL
ncbi:hypothetical protein SLEP1_g1680 [Rubroshorea leprosula]|uniref:Serine-threonine/tyrosine-protein kinase catalytic domain-containing protein n=1 Tax=Rubroshorea leprosula TaxID=152421 RepID=A0AAV5HEI5_9ROSI|nr:hypothetical protein SLEP1_g1680 [Rubroshorea leprosula]